MDYEKIARNFKKKKLYEPCQESALSVNYNQNDIKQILSHRDPFLLIDSIDSIDLENKFIIGKRNINKNDPVFKGHFPNYPIYPGVLHIEMMGQLGICLHYFLSREKTILEQNVKPMDIRLIKILHVFFQQEILPDEDVIIVCKELESNEYTSKGIGQIIKNDSVCTVSIAEFYIV